MHQFTRPEDLVVLYSSCFSDSSKSLPKLASTRAGSASSLIDRGENFAVPQPHLWPEESSQENFLLPVFPAKTNRSSVSPSAAESICKFQMQGLVPGLCKLRLSSVSRWRGAPSDILHLQLLPESPPPALQCLCKTPQSSLHQLKDQSNSVLGLKFLLFARPAKLFLARPHLTVESQ